MEHQAQHSKVVITDETIKRQVDEVVSDRADLERNVIVRVIEKLFPQQSNDRKTILDELESLLCHKREKATSQL